MRLRGAAHLGILIVLTALGTCVSVAHQVPANDVDLEAADDGGSGSQQIFYNPVDSTSLNHVVDPVQRNTREADRLYTSSMKILSSLRARNEQGERTHHSLDRIDNSETTSRLLVPISSTPLLDYLEASVDGRAKYLAHMLAAYRSLVGKPRGNSTEQDIKSDGDFMTKLLKAKYLRTGSKTPALKDKRRAAVTMAVQRLEKSLSLGKSEAALALADLYLWGRYDLPQNTIKAADHYRSIAQATGDPLAQYMLGFLHSSNIGYATDIKRTEGDGDQGAAVLHYTFSALSGQAEAEMTMGYRNWVGIGVKQSCPDALPWYKTAADKAMKAFQAGPPGGRHLPPPKVRLADVQGGVYGPGASATTAQNQHSHGANAVQPKTERDWEDLLEYYLFHADRGDAAFMFRIGRIYYQGFNPIGPNGGYGGSETGGRDFARALKWFMRIARAVWPRDPVAAYTSPAHMNANPARNGQGGGGGPNRQVSHYAYYDESKDVKLKVEDSKSLAAGLSAGYLGRMYLRGEGFPEQDFQKAFLWFQRGVSYGDRESHNGLGIMYRDGLGVMEDQIKALNHFQTAAAADHPEALVNVAKYHIARGELNVAISQLEHAIRHGDAFQAYYYLAEINNANPGRPELCPMTTAFYKIVAERGDWRTSQPWWEAERAWAVGDKKRALLGYWIMAERGYEVAQNNVAWILDQDKRMLSLPHYDYQLDKSTDRLALAFWTRSAAQDNGDALVKMGDYYMKGLGVSSSVPQPEKAAACYASAANTHYSSIAMYNLGWMHENGYGVSQDFHLAKRYYDLSLESNAEAYLPVTLSLAKLHLRSLYKAVKSGDIKSISLFLSNEYDPEEEAAEGQEQQSKPHRWLWSWRRIRDEFFRRWIGEQMARQQARQHVGPEHDLRPPQGEPPSPAPGQAPENNGQTLRQARVELEAQDDPMEWARRRREDMMQDVGDEFGADDLDIPDFFGDTVGGRGRMDDDGDFVETLAILGLCLVLAYLVYVRQARYDPARARQILNPNQVPQLVPAAEADAGPIPPAPEQVVEQPALPDVNEEAAAVPRVTSDEDEDV